MSANDAEIRIPRDGSPGSRTVARQQGSLHGGAGAMSTIAEYSALFRGREGSAGLAPRMPNASRSQAVARRPRFAARPAPRVLILSASAGVGHLRAAEAI